MYYRKSIPEGTELRDMPAVKRVSEGPMSKEAEEKRAKHEDEALRALRIFRQLIGSAKRHFQAVQAECGLSGAQLWALWQASAEPGLGVSQLARHLSIHQSTASNLLDELQDRGLIVRERVGRDQRVVRVYPTQAGQEILKRAPGPTRGVLAEAVHQLPHAQLHQLTGILERLTRHIDLIDRTAAKRPLSDLMSLALFGLYTWALELCDSGVIAAFL